MAGCLDYRYKKTSTLRLVLLDRRDENEEGLRDSVSPA